MDLYFKKFANFTDNNSRKLKIRIAKFLGHYFYINTNIYKQIFESALFHLQLIKKWGIILGMKNIQRLQTFRHLDLIVIVKMLSIFLLQSISQNISQYIYGEVNKYTINSKSIDTEFFYIFLVSFSEKIKFSMDKTIFVFANKSAKEIHERTKVKNTIRF